jgi:hypothetical protein
MKAKVYITLDIDEEDYPVPADGNVDEELGDAFREYIYDIDGVEVKTLKVISEKEE